MVEETKKPIIKKAAEVAVNSTKATIDIAKKNKLKLVLGCSLFGVTMVLLVQTGIITTDQALRMLKTVFTFVGM